MAVLTVKNYPLKPLKKLCNCVILRQKQFIQVPRVRNITSDTLKGFKGTDFFQEI